MFMKNPRLQFEQVEKEFGKKAFEKVQSHKSLFNKLGRNFRSESVRKIKRVAEFRFDIPIISNELKLHGSIEEKSTQTQRVLLAKKNTIEMWGKQEDPTFDQKVQDTAQNLFGFVTEKNKKFVSDVIVEYCTK